MRAIAISNPLFITTIFDSTEALLYTVDLSVNLLQQGQAILYELIDLRL